MDLYATNRHFIIPIEAGRFLPRDPAVEAPQAGAGPGTRLQPSRARPSATFFQYHGIETLGGWADNEYGLYREFRGFDYQQNPNFVQGLAFNPADGTVGGNVFLDMLNTTHLTYALQDRPGTQVARNRSALPRAWFVTRWESLDADKVIARLKEPGFDPGASPMSPRPGTAGGPRARGAGAGLLAGLAGRGPGADIRAVTRSTTASYR